MYIIILLLFFLKKRGGGENVGVKEYKRGGRHRTQLMRLDCIHKIIMDIITNYFSNNHGI